MRSRISRQNGLVYNVAEPKLSPSVFSVQLPRQRALHTIIENGIKATERVNVCSWASGVGKERRMEGGGGVVYKRKKAKEGE